LLVAIALYVTGLLSRCNSSPQHAASDLAAAHRLISLISSSRLPIVLIAIFGRDRRVDTAGQTAVYLVSSELDRRTAALHGVAQMLAQTPAGKRQNTIREVALTSANRFSDCRTADPRERCLSLSGGFHACAAPAGGSTRAGSSRKIADCAAGLT